VTFCTAATMSALLDISRSLWADVMTHLRVRSGGVQESGAFLLGYKGAVRRTTTAFLPYEKLQRDALHDDHVQLTAASFARLWELCRHEQLSVVADIHTHPGNAFQSRSDRNNPMVAIPGHIAFIVPRFAQGQVQLGDVMVYVYRGNHTWDSYGASDVKRVVQLIEQGAS